jgi:hypothetical protein
MRTRRTSLSAILLVAAALVAGCGGSEVAPDEVPGGPVSLTVPEDEQLGGSSDSADSSSQDSADATANAGTADAAAAADGTTTDPSATTDDTSGGATAPAPAPTDDTSGGTTAPAPADDGTAAPDTGTGGTSEFCEQNAGAC